MATLEKYKSKTQICIRNNILNVHNSSVECRYPHRSSSKIVDRVVSVNFVNFPREPVEVSASICILQFRSPRKHTFTNTLEC